MPGVVHCRKGFTLLEVILAMMLILMIAAIGLPALDGFSNERKMRAAFTSVADPIEDGMQKAREERIDYWIHLNEGNLLVTPAGEVDWDLNEKPTVGEGRLKLLDRDHDAPAVRLWASGHAEPFRLQWESNDGRWVVAAGPLDRRLRIVEWEVK